MTFPLTDRFAQALSLAHAWHKGQLRKGTGIPYVAHLLGVASIALDHGATEDQAIAALLHDALEDGPQHTGQDASALRQQIAQQFGEEVARIVDACTDATPRAGEPKAPWAERKRNYLASLPHKGAPELLVSASDKLHNARAILSDVLATPQEERGAYFGRFNPGQAGTLEYYRLLVDAYRTAPASQEHEGLGRLLAELERTVSATEAACGLTADEVRAFEQLAAVT